MKRNKPLLGLYDLKQGVDRVLEDFHDPKKPKMVSKRRLALEIALLTEVKKELAGILPLSNFLRLGTMK